jgi:phosphohistidine phosphatase
LWFPELAESDEMRLYLVQHGDALAKEIDPDRPLSEKGRLDMENLAHFLKGRFEVSEILHSGKNRARQSAEMLLESFSTPPEMVEFPNLKPQDDPGRLIAWLQTRQGDTLVVGHLPYVSRLTHSLIGGAGNQDVVSFTPGSMVCLEGSGETDWRIQWILRPELF